MVYDADWRLTRGHSAGTATVNTSFVLGHSAKSKAKGVSERYSMSRATNLNNEREDRELRRQAREQEKQPVVDDSSRSPFSGELAVAQPKFFDTILTSHPVDSIELIIWTKVHLSLRANFKAAGASRRVAEINAAKEVRRVRSEATAGTGTKGVHGDVDVDTVLKGYASLRTRLMKSAGMQQAPAAMDDIADDNEDTASGDPDEGVQQSHDAIVGLGHDFPIDPALSAEYDASNDVLSLCRMDTGMPIAVMLDDDGSEETYESSDQISRDIQPGSLNAWAQKEFLLTDQELSSNTVLVDDSGKVDELAATCSSHPLLLNGLEISCFLATYNQATAPTGMTAAERAKPPEETHNNFAPIDIRHSRAPASWRTFRCPFRNSCLTTSANPAFFLKRHICTTDGGMADADAPSKNGSKAKSVTMPPMLKFTGFGALGQAVPRYAALPMSKLPSGVEAIDVVAATATSKSPLSDIVDPDGVPIPRYSRHEVAIVELTAKPFSGLFTFGPPVTCTACSSGLLSYVKWRTTVSAGRSHAETVHKGESVVVRNCTPSELHRLLQEDTTVPPPLPDDVLDGTVKVGEKLTPGFVCIHPGCEHRAVTLASIKNHVATHGYDITTESVMNRMRASRYDRASGFTGTTSKSVDVGDAATADNRGKKNAAAAGSRGMKQTSDSTDDGASASGPKKQFKSDIKDTFCPFTEDGCKRVAASTSSRVKIHLLYDHGRTSKQADDIMAVLQPGLKVTVAKSIKGTQPFDKDTVDPYTTCAESGCSQRLALLPTPTDTKQGRNPNKHLKDVHGKEQRYVKDALAKARRDFAESIVGTY